MSSFLCWHPLYFCSCCSHCISPLEQQFSCECRKPHSADNSCNQPPFREPQAPIWFPPHKDESNLGKQQHSKESIPRLHAAAMIGRCSCELSKQKKKKRATRVKQSTPPSHFSSNMAALAVKLDRVENINKAERGSSLLRSQPKQASVNRNVMLDNTRQMLTYLQLAGL